MSNVSLPMLPPRPRTRGECADVERPCPFVSCAMHLMISVKQTGRLVEHFDDIDEMDETCALDVADRGPTLLKDISRFFGEKTPQFARALEERGLKRLRIIIDEEFDDVLTLPMGSPSDFFEDAGA